MSADDSVRVTPIPLHQHVPDDRPRLDGVEIDGELCISDGETWLQSDVFSEVTL